MLRNIFDEPVPVKLRRDVIYDMIKAASVISVVKGKILFKDDDDTWRYTSDIEAKLKIRALFTNPEWQAVLDDGSVGELVRSLKTDPDLQKEATEYKHSNFLKVRNGIWDIAEEKLVPDTGTLLFNRILDVELSTELLEESKVFNNFCASIFSEETLQKKKQALYEIIGYAISDSEAAKLAIFLIGPANCGKSLLLKFMQKLVGEEYVSNVPLSGLAQRFSVAEMYEKVLNISGEVPSGILPGRAFDMFKGITGGDRIQLERKGCHPFTAVVNAKLIFAGNTLPVFGKVDGTDSLLERLHILLFDKEVPEEERDCYLLEKLWKERDLIVRHSMKALKLLEENNKKFMKLSDEENLLMSLKHLANPIDHFIESKMCRAVDAAIHITDAYEAYKKLALEEALPDIDRTTFRNLMATQPGISIGKTKRRLGKRSPQVCFEGIKLLEENWSDKKQDTKMHDVGGDKL